MPNLRRAGDEIGNLLAGLDGRYVPAGPSGTLTRGGAHVLPTGRNFYSLDPKALPDASWRGTSAAGWPTPLLARHLAEEGDYPQPVGLVLWGTALMRTQGDDVAEALALLGVRPVWEAESRRVVGLEPIPLAELGRPRIDVTLRISRLLPRRLPQPRAPARRRRRPGRRRSTRPPSDNFVRAHGTDDPRIYGPPPGCLRRRASSPPSSSDRGAPTTTWPPSTSPGRAGPTAARGYGVADEDAMRRRFAAIDVAVKNQDNREHDIFDSDDYLQDHGGMVATIRSLTGADPKAWFGDSADPSHPVVRSLAEEAARVVRTRVVNPRWIEAMQRHGYKGAFEMAATVDYLFGYDATAQVVDDWMYEKVTAAYVADPAGAQVLRAVEPVGAQRRSPSGSSKRPSATCGNRVRRISTCSAGRSWRPRAGKRGAEAPQSASVPGRQHRCRRLARGFRSWNCTADGLLAGPEGYLGSLPWRRAVGSGDP